MTDVGSVAPLWRRAVAALVDVVVSGALWLGAFALVLGPSELGRLLVQPWPGLDAPASAWFEHQGLREALLVVHLVWLGAFEAATGGRTPGKRLLGLRAEGARGERLSILHAAARNGTKLLAAVPLGLGLAWSAVRRDRRGWHDLLAGTRVARSR